MKPRAKLRFLIAALLVSVLWAACDAVDRLTPTLTLTLTLAPTSTRLLPSVDTGWLRASEGIETRELSIVHQGRRDRLFIARVDPVKVSFHVRYDPIDPRRVREWLDVGEARLAINGGFFDPDGRALGMVIAEGEAFGQTYTRLGGLFGVRAGRVQVRSLIAQPYRPDEVFDQMVQSFPTLLVGAGAINAQIRDDGRLAPRSAVGVDRAGRVVFLVSPRATFSLTDLAAWLAQSDLDLDAVLNLDGGTSTGLIVHTASGAWGINSWVEVPVAIVVR